MFNAAIEVCERGMQTTQSGMLEGQTGCVKLQVHMDSSEDRGVDLFPHSIRFMCHDFIEAES